MFDYHKLYFNIVRRNIFSYIYGNESKSVARTHIFIHWGVNHLTVLRYHQFFQEHFPAYGRLSGKILLAHHIHFVEGFFYSLFKVHLSGSSVSIRVPGWSFCVQQNRVLTHWGLSKKTQISRKIQINRPQWKKYFNWYLVSRVCSIMVQFTIRSALTQTPHCISHLREPMIQFTPSYMRQSL